MATVFIKLLNISITASRLVLAVALVRLIFKKAPRALLCALWALVAVRLMVPISIESALSLLPTAEPITDDVIEEIFPSRDPDIGVDDGPISSDTDAVIDLDSMPVYIIDLVDPEPKPETDPIQIASVVWHVGIAAMTAYAVISYLRLCVKLREAVTLEDNIRICDHVPSPFIIGVMRPRIILPSSMAESDREHVIAHERAHLHRFDHLWKPLGFALLTVYWFNPVMWLAYVLLCRDIELACDERVIKKMSTDDRRAYTTALLNASVSRKMISACPLAFGEVGVGGRIRSVLNYKKPAFWLIIAAVVVSVVVAVGFLTDPPSSEEFSEEMIIRVELVTEEKTELRLLEIADRRAVVLDGDNYIEELYARVIDIDERGEAVTISFNKKLYHDSPESVGETINEITLPVGEKVTVYTDLEHQNGEYTFEIIPFETALAEIPNYDTPYFIDTVYHVDENTLATVKDGFRFSKSGTLEDAEDGDEIIVLYSGGVRESYPPQLIDCYGVYIYSRAAETGAVVGQNYGMTELDGVPEQMYMGALNSEKMAVSSVQHLPIFKLENASELDAFENSYGGVMLTPYTEGYGISSFESIAKKCDEAFFRENVLLVVGVSGVEWCTSGGVFRSENGLVVHINEMSYLYEKDPVNVDKRCFLVAIAVSKADIDGVSEYDACLSSLRFYPLEYEDAV